VNTLTILTTTLILSATICASHVSGRLASQAPSPQLSEPVALTAGSETTPPAARDALPGVEHDE